MSKQAANCLLGQLERLGYLERRPDAGDRRSKRVALTERGERAGYAIRDAVRDVEREWEAQLGPEAADQRFSGEYVPAGLMEDCFRKAGFPTHSATLPPPEAPSRPTDVIEGVMRTHDHHNVGPPLGPGDQPSPRSGVPASLGKPGRSPSHRRPKQQCFQ
jgi:hypothetical protein